MQIPRETWILLSSEKPTSTEPLHLLVKYTSTLFVLVLCCDGLGGDGGAGTREGWGGGGIKDTLALWSTVTQRTFKDLDAFHLRLDPVTPPPTPPTPHPTQRHDPPNRSARTVAISRASCGSNLFSPSRICLHLAWPRVALLGVQPSLSSLMAAAVCTPCRRTPGHPALMNASASAEFRAPTTSFSWGFLRLGSSGFGLAWAVI